MGFVDLSHFPQRGNKAIIHIVYVLVHLFRPPLDFFSYLIILLFPPSIHMLSI